MTRFWGALARIPNPVVALLLVVGGVTIPIHERLVAHVHATGAPEPEQWLAFLTFKWYWATLPLAVLVLWARRRSAQGLLGRVAAWLNLLGGPAQYAVLLISSLVWGLLLGRGDLPTALMVLEFLGYLIPVGTFLAGVAMLRDRALPRWQGGLVAVLAVASWVPFGALVVGTVLAALLITTGRRRPVLDSPVAATAP
jgi:hypothetical protein